MKWNIEICGDWLVAFELNKKVSLEILLEEFVVK